jgi:cell wall-associated NlpC family hydrolase
VPNVNDRKPGDFVFFKWPGVSHDFCDHVGIYAGNGQTIEGNTSSGTSGSQNNGGGVFVRVRGFANVVAVVRPTYR